MVKADLVANWTFNEGSGGTAYDSSPFGNNCTINNASWVSRLNGNALSFNGFDSYLDCGNDSSLNFGTGDFTIIGWIKSNTNGGGYFVSKENAWTGLGYDSGIIDQYGDPNFLYTADGGVYHVLDWTNVSDNNWHLLALVRNQTTLAIYIDGIRDNTSVAIPPSDVSTIQNFLIGCEYNSGGYTCDITPFNGMMDEVRIWNEAKDGAFILQTYNNEKLSGTPVHYDIFSIINMVFDLIGTIIRTLLLYISAIVEIIILTGLVFAVGYIIKQLMDTVFKPIKKNKE